MALLNRPFDVSLGLPLRHRETQNNRLGLLTRQANTFLILRRF